MVSIKKVNPIRIIEQEEFINALHMNSKWHNKEDQPSESNIADYQKYEKIFEEEYGVSWFFVIFEIFKWKDYIFKGKIPIIEVYKNYTECISKNQKEPLITKRWENEKEVGTEWVFNGYAYEVKGLYTDNEIKLLILEDFDKEQGYFEKLRLKFEDTGFTQNNYERLRIPENVRIEIWRRDEGKCARCGSREKLEYDHIVPISKGGSNTSRNIELLCEKCNRSKSNNIV